MALAVAMTAALGEWLCLQREMQDIQLGSGAGVNRTRVSAYISSQHVLLPASGGLGLW